MSATEAGRQAVLKFEEYGTEGRLRMGGSRCRVKQDDFEVGMQKGNIAYVC